MTPDKAACNATMQTHAIHAHHAADDDADTTTITNTTPGFCLTGQFSMLMTLMPDSQRFPRKPLWTAAVRMHMQVTCSISITQADNDT